jgi:antitoxin (DNA-binding transcriptional repressor) of toxin-antitoxin stability system
LARDPFAVFDRVEGGESLVITRNGSPVAELRPAPKSDPSPRPHGLAKGLFRTPDDFNEPLPEEVLGTRC